MHPSRFLWNELLGVEHRELLASVFDVVADCDAKPTMRRQVADGGKSTGRPATHGQFTQEAMTQRSRLLELNRELRELLRSI